MRRKLSPLALLPLLVAGAAGCGDRGLGPDVVATAADFQFGVEEAARMIAPVEEIPDDVVVVEALADFWTDYTLLALVVNEEGALEALDLTPVTGQHLDQELVLLLRDEVIEVDLDVPDEELREIYETQRPGERVRARHVLLLFPEGADEAQQDSVWALAEDIRDRARAGADFAAMAEEYSDDTGSAERGGDLGFFTRDTMVPPFEEAAFALEPGEVSEIVESEHGLHVIRVEEREFPELEEIAEDLRSEIQMARQSVAESIFVAGIEEPAAPSMADGAVPFVREIAEDPMVPLGRDSDRALVEFEGGTFTARQFRIFLLNQPAQAWDQISQFSRSQIETLLLDLTRGELLVREARERGITLPEGRVEELEAEYRNEYRFAAERLGLDTIEPEEGESLRDAVDRTMRDLMPRLVRGEQDVQPLGPLGIPLRERYDARFSRENMERAADRVAELRAEGLGGDEELEAEESPLTEDLPDQEGEPGGDPGDEGEPPA